MSSGSRLGKRSRALGLCVLLAVAFLPGSGRAAGKAYAITRGGTYIVGDSELVVPTLTVLQGTELVFLNLNAWGHSLVSDAWLTPSIRLFRSDVIPFGKQSVVQRVDSLPPGMYPFHCSNHGGMRGSITVI